MEANVISLNKNELIQLAQDALKDKVPQGFVLRGEQIEFEFDLEEEEKGVYDFEVRVSANLLPGVKSEEVVKKIRGKYPNLAEEYLNQEVAGFRTFPKAEHSEGSIIFSWDNPKESELYLSAYSEVKKTNAFPQVKTKVPFPIKYIPEEFLQYIQPSETIDSDYSEITRAASKLAEGEDDLFVVVYKIADWTKNNVNYNLSTLTAEISQKASWVLETSTESAFQKNILLLPKKFLSLDAVSRERTISKAESWLIFFRPETVKFLIWNTGE